MSKPAIEEISSEQEGVSESLVHHGFTEDPFEEPVNVARSDELAPFFMGGGRRSVLDEVLHLCRFSHNIVAVLGEAGVGKTALVSQAVVELEESTHCCFISSTVMVTAADVMTQLASHLGIFLPEGSTIDQSIRLISRYQPVGLQQRIVIIADDAHHLNDHVLAVLVRILQEQSSYHFHVLLVGDSSLMAQLDQLDKGDVFAYDIPLNPFSQGELEAYLSFKLATVGYQGAELFDYHTIEAIWRETSGIPASVNRAAKQRLLNHRFVTALDSERRSVLVGTATSFGTANETDTSVDSAPLSNEPPTEGDLTVSQDASKALPGVAEAPLKSPLDDAQPVEETVNETQPIDFSSILIDSGTDIEASVDRRVNNVVDIPPQEAAATTAIEAPSANAAMTEYERAVMSWPAEQYTLQVTAAGQLAGVERFVSRQPNRRSLRIVSFNRNQQPWYVVLIGVYPTVEDARSAALLLPIEQSGAQPWPRKIGDIKRRINDAQ